MHFIWISVFLSILISASYFCSVWVSELKSAVLFSLHEPQMPDGSNMTWNCYLVLLLQSSDSVMLALKLNGSTLLERKIRVKRSVKKEKEKKSHPGRPSGGFKGFRNRKQTQASSFKGEAADPAAKRGKGLKKKFKNKKKKPAVHIWCLLVSQKHDVCLVILIPFNSHWFSWLCRSVFEWVKRVWILAALNCNLVHHKNQ